MLSFVRNKNTKKISYVVSGFLLLIVTLGIFFPGGVSAQGVGDFVGGWFMTGIKSILYAIFVAVGTLVSAAISLFEYGIDPTVYGTNGLFNKGSVYNMWKFIRDFFNLFFILTLLYTAFTIVFQIAGNYKKTLLSIVLAALFVNFSFPLTRVMIDAANVPMYYFANLIMSSSGGSTTSASATLGPALSASGLKEILIPKEKEITGMDVSQILMAIIFLFVFMVTLMVLAILFVIRMMALLVLVMFSAVGFAGSVIPGMKQYSDMWWDKFRQYALFGPAAMFMLYMATRLFQEISKDSTQQTLKTNMAANATAQSSSFLASVGMYSITIIMLWIAIGLANSMSIVGASAIAGRGQQFLKWAGKKSTVSPAMWAGRKVDSKLAGSKNLSFLSPGAWRMALKQRGEEQKHQDEQPIKQTAARRQDQLNDVVSRATQAGAATWGGLKFWKIPGAAKTAWKTPGKDHTDHNFAQTQAQAGEYRKEISDVSTQSDYVINEMKAALATGNTAKVDASLQILAKNNDLNDMLTGLDPKKVKEYGIEDVDAKGNAVVSSENMMLALEGILRESGERDSELLAKKMTVIGDSATNAGNFAFGGMTVFDKKENNGRGGFRLAKKEYKKKENGEFEKDENGNKIVTVDEQADWARGKVKNLESQKRQTSLHPDSLFTRSSTGFGDINGQVAKEIIGTFTSADVAQVDRSRDDLKQAIHDAYSNADKNPQFMAMYKDNEMFKNYVDSVVRMKRGKKKDADGTSDSKSQWYKDNAPGTKYKDTPVAPVTTDSMSSGASGAPIALDAGIGSGGRSRPRTP